MSPRLDGHGRDRKARGWRAADQARPALLAVLVLALPGCTDRWAELDPRPVVANIFGAHLEGREPPPGLDQPWPNLASVPARPEPPDAATRARVSDRLAQDRAASRAPVAPGGGAAPALGAAPPAPPRLAAVPPIRLDPAPAPAAPAALPVPPPAAPRPAEPAAAPPAVAPPPPPPRELLAPPPPPSPDLLAPRRN